MSRPKIRELLNDWVGVSLSVGTIDKCIREVGIACSPVVEELSELAPKEQQVITLRFGLIDGNELTLSQIGERLGLSRERIRQIQQRALTKLRKHKYEMGSYLHN